MSSVSLSLGLSPTILVCAAVLDCVKVAFEMVKNKYYEAAVNFLHDAAVEKVAQLDQIWMEKLNKPKLMTTEQLPLLEGDDDGEVEDKETKAEEELWNRASSYYCHALRATALNYLGRYIEAIEASSLAIKYLPGDDFAYNTRAYAYCALREYDTRIL